MDIEHRKTTLGDDASIYNRAKDTVTKEELKQLTLKQKIVYFKDYYLIGTVALIAIVGLVVYMLYNSVINPKNEVLTVAFLNGAYVGDATAMSDSIESYIGMERDRDYVSVSYYDIDDYQMNMAYMTVAGAGQLDVIICPYEDFERQANMGLLGDLKKFLPEDMYAELSDRMITGHSIDMDIDGTVLSVGDELDYGIDISQSAACREFVTTASDRMVLCIFGAPKNPENTLKAIRYFLEE